MHNTAVGSETLQSNTVGHDNTAMGYGVLQNNTTGYGNTAMGWDAMYSNITGSNNIAIGNQALANGSNGNGNVAIGSNSMAFSAASSNNTAVGTMTVVSPDITNSTALGYAAAVTVSNKVRIGNAAVTVIEGQVPFTSPSDGRFKYNVREDVGGLDFILKLRPVTYQFDVKRFDGVAQHASYAMQTSYNEAAAIRRTGFIAQEVEKAAKQTGYNFSGIIFPKNEKEHYSLSYESFVVPLVKSVQEQQLIIEKQASAIKEQQAIIETLTEKLEALTKKVETLSTQQ
jgi:trimeric autotransporter adhesin